MIEVTHSGQLKQFRVIGIHLAGASTKRSALVRGSFFAEKVFSGTIGALHEKVKPAFSSWFSGFEVLPANSVSFGVPAISPLVIDAQISGLGPESDQDADSRFLEALQDLGRADFYVFDAPLGLPPCTKCTLSCPGSLNCCVPEVVAMNDLWRLMRLKGRKEKTPSPYVDRYFDYFARQVLDDHSRVVGLEFESPLGSNRAPLTARALHLSKRIHREFPTAQIFETNSIVAAMGWVENFKNLLEVPKGVEGRLSEIRRPFGGLRDRRHVVKSLSSTLRLTFGAALHSTLAQEFSSSPEIFFAGMSALMPRCLAAGEVFLQDEFFDANSPHSGFSLLPSSVGRYIESDLSTRGQSEPL